MVGSLAALSITAWPSWWHICGMSTTDSGSLGQHASAFAWRQRRQLLARHQRGQRAFEAAQIQLFIMSAYTGFLPRAAKPLAGEDVR